MAYDPATRQLTRTKSLNGDSELGEAFSAALEGDLGIARDSLELLMHGTTVVTNLILERDGAKVGLIATRGFRDVLEIGWSFRDDAYDPQWTKFEALVPRSLRIEADERIGPDGRVERELDEQRLRAELAVLREAGVEAVAVCLLHSYANPAHEQRVREVVAAELPGVPCVASSEVDPRLGEYERVSTTVLSAYATPRLSDYIERIEDWVGAGRGAYFMQSEGGVIPARAVLANPTAMVLSGPAAGVLAACHVGEAMGQRDLISIDVGGTSADVSIIKDGEPGLREVLEIEPGVPLRSPCLDVVAVGAGGGSIAWIDQGGALQVGPDQRRRRPRPRLLRPRRRAADGDRRQRRARHHRRRRAARRPPARRPGGGGAGGRPARRAAGDVGRRHRARHLPDRQRDDGAGDPHLTVQRGIDPREFALISYGGAGGQHSAEVAREMLIPRVVFPPHPSTFSALGLLAADVQATRVHPVVSGLEAVERGYAEERFEQLERSGLDAFREVAGNGAAPEFARFADLRYAGQVHSIRTAVEVWEPARIGRDFEDLHEVRYGTRLGDPIEVVNLGVTSRLPLAKPELGAAAAAAGGAPFEQIREAKVLVEGREIPVIARASIQPGAELPTPCLVEEGDSVLYLPGRSSAHADPHGNLICDLEQPA